MSSNNIMTQDFAETIAATIKKEIPVLEFVNKDLTNKVASGGGDVVSVIVPNYGRVGEGASLIGNGGRGGAANVFNLDPNVNATDFTGTNGWVGGVPTAQSLADLQVITHKVPVTLRIRHIAASYDLLEKTLKLYTQNTQIREPRLSQLASYVNKDVFFNVFISAGSSIVGSIGFLELADAVAYVDESRVGDETNGVLSPLLNNSIAASGANKFAHSRIGSDLYDGVLGSWMDADFIKTADAGSIKIGTRGATDSFAFTGTVLPVADGANTLTLTVDTPAAGYIPAGTPLVIVETAALADLSTSAAGQIDSPYTVASVYGDDTQISRTFVVMPNDGSTGNAGIGGNYTIGGNAGGTTIVRIAEVRLATKSPAGIMLNTSLAVPNTFRATPTANVPASYSFVCPLLTGYKYALGAVFADKCIAFAGASLKPFGGNTDTQSTTLDGELNIRTTIDPLVPEGSDLWRVDTLYGMSALYGNGSVALYGLIQ